jgi:hypothetical protein
LVHKVANVTALWSWCVYILLACSPMMRLPLLMFSGHNLQC